MLRYTSEFEFSMMEETYTLDLSETYTEELHELPSFIRGFNDDSRQDDYDVMELFDMLQDVCLGSVCKSNYRISPIEESFRSYVNTSRWY